jgi:ABC-type transport system involved in cytochrome bd biosynthesis fused ATPase/permease subunit
MLEFLIRNENKKKSILAFSQRQDIMLQSAQVIYVEYGEVTESGNFNELLTHKTGFLKISDDYGRKWESNQN